MLKNIKSKFILNLIFGYLKNKIKLKIVKHNKNLLFKLNIGFEDFQKYQLIKELNWKYNTNIKDINAPKLEFKYKLKKYRENKKEVLEYIEKIGFRDLKELYIFYGNISDITKLENVRFNKLEILNLKNNKIENIDVFEKVNFPELKELNLKNNEIKDINALEKAQFRKLLCLNLSRNKIENIDILEKVYFKELKKLSLKLNRIADIKVLEKVKFEKMEMLNLCYNRIENIDVLEKVNFKGLKN